MNNYLNQDALLAAEALAISVSPTVKVISRTLLPQTNIVKSIIVSIPQKKNKKKIVKLVALGFKTIRRRMGNIGNVPEGETSFLIDLEYTLPEFKED